MSLRRTVLVLAVAVVLLMGLMAVDSHRGRRSRRYSRSSRYSKPPPRTIVTNTTRYGDSNVCKMCTTSTFHCNETFYRGCPPNYTDKGKRDDDDDGRRRGRRHATHHHSHEHHDRWNEWNNNNRQESTNNASSAKLVAVYAGGRKCKYELAKTCTESKCEVKCCDGTEKEPGSNSCKNRRRNDGTLNGCLNGGTLNSGRTHCTCPEDFVGLQCQHRKCAKSCQNGGQCKTNTTHTAGRQGDTSYNDDYCVCPSETSGEFCEKKICDKDCKNNGTCVRRGRSWTYCMCQPGFSGSECEKKMKEGECPMRQDSGSVCTWYNRKYTCFHDEDCEGSKKCCRDQCFARECVEPASPNVTCSYSNVTYELGSVFNPDACRVCTCNASHMGLLQGAIQCTRIMCPVLPSTCKNVTTPPDACCPMCNEKSSDLCGDNYEMPYFVNCPDEEIAIDVERGSNVAKVNLTLVAKDCQGQQLHVTLSEDRFQAGLGDENYHLLSASSAFDGRGNFAECLFRIRVRDTEPPKFITCPMDVVEAANMPASWPLPVARDNVGLKTAPTSVRHPGQMLPPGEYMIDYWAEDYEGNIASCSFVVTVMSSHHETHPGEHNHSHPHPHPHPHDNHHHQPHTSASRQPESPNNALKVGVGIAVVALVGLLIVFGYFFYRRFRRMSNAAQGGGLGASTVRMSSVVGGGGGGGLGGWGIGGGAGTMESLPPRYGMSPEEIMSPPGYDMMATGGGGGVPPEAGELPAKSPLPQ